MATSGGSRVGRLNKLFQLTALNHVDVRLEVLRGAHFLLQHLFDQGLEGPPDGSPAEFLKGRAGEVAEAGPEAVRTFHMLADLLLRLGSSGAVAALA